jgi:hypothetical protein
MTDMSLSVTGTDILMMFSATVRVGASDAMFVVFDVDGTDYHVMRNFNNLGDRDDTFCVGMQYYLSGLADASHTVKVQWKQSGGTAYQDGASYPRVLTARVWTQ